MKLRSGLVAGVLFLLPLHFAFGEVRVAFDRNQDDQATAAFKFKNVPSPVAHNAAADARFSIVDGERDENGGGLAVLHDGRLPSEQDAPADNFFFNAGTEGGRIKIDLGRPIDIRQINTYSWHTDTRAPQVYSVYGSDGGGADFNAAPGSGVDPAKAGWKLIAKVDTRPKTGDPGGQYGVSVSDSDGSIGKYRYLLFDISRTEDADTFGNTFYSEINVISPDSVAAAAESQPAVPPIVVRSTDGKCEITIDVSRAPDLKEWAETKLAPTLAAWYPKICEMLPSEGFTPPTQFRVTLRPGRGVAATSGTRISGNSTWFKTELNREAVGALVHEEVHVVQQYGYGRGFGANRGTANPVWLVEGIADYIRWWKYEPDSPRRYPNPNSPRTRYDGSYTITANFLHWVTEKYDADIVKQLNAAMRAHKYTAEMWKQYTGKDLSDLGTEWKESLKKRD